MNNSENQFNNEFGINNELWDKLSPEDKQEVAYCRNNKIRFRIHPEGYLIGQTRGKKSQKFSNGSYQNTDRITKYNL
jgi:hypothetical protein